jgi:hypothetical protein
MLTNTMMFIEEGRAQRDQAQAPRTGRLYTGLCRDCENSPTCTFPREPLRPVWSCDEYTPPTSSPAPLPERVSVSPSAPAPSAEAEEVKGLCRYCLNRVTCQFPKSPGGVWHCEELA